MTLTAADVWRDYNTLNVPGSGVHQPEKRDIRAWGAVLEAFLVGTQAGGGVVFQTKVEANGKLAYNVNQIAWVVADGTAANNGIYQKQGASGSGSWLRVADLPYSFYRAVNSGAGTANAIIANGVGAPRASDSALISFNITAANTSPTVTVALDDGTPLAIKTVTGNSPSIGGLTAGMIVSGFIAPDNEFHLISDQASAAIQAAAEAAQAAAEDARDLAIAAADQAAVEGAGDVPTYPSRAYAEAATIPTARTYLIVAGYAAKGDAPLVLYTKMDSAPSPAKAWHFQSADGAWWELVMEYVTPEMFGAVGDGAITGDAIGGYTVTGTDDADALQAWADYPALDKRALGKIYATTKTVNLPVNSKVSAIKGKSWIAGKASGTWTSTTYESLGAVVNCGGELIALPDLAASGGKNAVSVTLASAPTLYADDVAVIHNPTDNSWMTDAHLTNDRPYYQDGEMVRTRDVSGSVVTFTSPLKCSTYANYDKDVVDIYRIPQASIHIDGLSVHAPFENGAMAINISLLTSVTLDNIKARNSNSQTVQVDRCFDVVANHPDIQGLGPSGQIYGWVTSNCQNVTVIKPLIESLWHAVANGGNNLPGCVPTRDVYVHGGYVSATVSTATDAHGNCQNINFIDCIISNGVGFGGDGTMHKNCHVIGRTVQGGVVALGSEIVGGDHRLEGCTFSTESSPTGGRGVIDVGGNSDVLTSDTRRAGRLLIRNCEILGDAIVGSGGSLVPAVKVGTHGSLAKPFDVVIAGFKGPTQMTRILEYNVGSGAQEPNRITVDDIDGFAAGADLVVFPAGNPTSTFCKLMAASGAVGITCASGNSINKGNQNFPYSYPAPPFLTAELSPRAADGSSELKACVDATDNAIAKLSIVRTDAGNFSSTVTRTVRWDAAINGRLAAS